MLEIKPLCQLDFQESGQPARNTSLILNLKEASGAQKKLQTRTVLGMWLYARARTDWQFANHYTKAAWRGQDPSLKPAASFCE